MERDALIATYALVATVLAAVWESSLLSAARPSSSGLTLTHHVGGKTRAWLSLLSTHATHGGFSTHEFA